MTTKKQGTTAGAKAGKNMKNDKRASGKSGSDKGASGKRASGNGGGRVKTFDAKLQSAVAAVDVATSLTAPMTKSIENLMRIAAQSVGSDEASVLVREGQEGDLRFSFAIGQVADKLIGVNVPAGKGIAGFVFASGQPMAVADVAQEQSFYAEVDKQTGYTTQTILATPLRAGDEIVGVLEFVNRIGDPPYEPFTPEEMDRAAHFADAIAILVDAQESAGLIETLFARVLSSVGDGATQSQPDKSRGGKKATGKAGKTAAAQRGDAGEELRQWLASVRAAPEHKDMMRLAVALRDVAERGEAERELCRRVIEALAEFTSKRSNQSGMSFLSF